MAVPEASWSWRDEASENEGTGCDREGDSVMVCQCTAWWRKHMFVGSSRWVWMEVTWANAVG